MNDLLKRTYRCDSCNKTYKNKIWFERHKCKAAEEANEMAKSCMDNAFQYWKYWMRVQRMLPDNEKKVSVERFQKSRLKREFIRLSQFMGNKEIPDPYLYIDWLIERRIPVKSWCNDDIKFQDDFARFSNHHESPLYHTKVFIGEVRKWVLAHPSSTPEDFFNQLSPCSVLDMVRQKKLKQWVLLAYDPIYFKWSDNRKISGKMRDVVDFPYWADKIRKNPDSVEYVKNTLDEMLWDCRT